MIFVFPCRYIFEDIIMLLITNYVVKVCRYLQRYLPASVQTELEGGGGEMIKRPSEWRGVMV